jgi:hypothetical protein
MSGQTGTPPGIRGAFHKGCEERNVRRPEALAALIAEWSNLPAMHPAEHFSRAMPAVLTLAMCPMSLVVEVDHPAITHREQVTSFRRFRFLYGMVRCVALVIAVVILRMMMVLRFELV